MSPVRVVDQNLVEMRIVEKDVPRIRSDECRDVCVRERAPQGTDERRSQNDVTDAVGADDKNAGMNAFLEKRKPKYRNA